MRLSPSEKDRLEFVRAQLSLQVQVGRKESYIFLAGYGDIQAIIYRVPQSFRESSRERREWETRHDPNLIEKR